MAIRAVAIAGELAENVRKNFTTIDKPDGSPVTVADLAVQAYVISKLYDEFQDAKFIAEETTNLFKEQNGETILDDVVAALKPFDAKMDKQKVIDTINRCDFQGTTDPNIRTFILDPVDGTKGFVGGEKRQYCIALGMTVGGRAVLGVLGCPNLPLDSEQPNDVRGVVFHATLRQGAYMMSQTTAIEEPNSLGERIFVSGRSNPAEIRLAESVEAKHSNHGLSAQVREYLGANEEAPIRMDSQAKYGCLARGNAEVFLRFPSAGYAENTWDHCGGVVVMEEAGGKVTDGTGKPLDFSHGPRLYVQNGIVASNGIMHDQIIEAVKKAFAATSIGA